MERYYDIRIPDTGHDFEMLTKKVCESKFGIPFELYGRNGQEQNGIDLFSNAFSICVQCKNYQGHDASKRLMATLQKDYFSAINKFGRQMKKFVLATTALRDTSVQDLAVELSINSNVEIHVLFWEDFQEILREHPEFIGTHINNADAEQKLLTLADALYKALCEFRNSVNMNNNLAVNAALEKVTDVVRKTYVLGERYSQSKPAVCEKCNQIVNQYNVFVQAYSAFVIEFRNGRSSRSEALALAGDKEFEKLLNLSLTHLQTS